MAQGCASSRPLVIKEIEEGRLPHRKVGTRRRVAFEDRMSYAREMRKRQEGALERMTENARELGLDYGHGGACTLQRRS